MATSCVEWTGAKSKGGYGQKWDGEKVQYVHRMTYAEYHGVTLSSSDVVMHTCDNRACYAIDHLVLGTQANNLADMKAKGRQAREFGLPQTRLSDADIVVIREARAAGARNMDLAEQYGVARSHISKIVCGHARKEAVA